MKKLSVIFVSVILVLVTGKYFYFNGKEYIVNIPEITLQQKIAEKLPLTKSYLLIFEITLSNPRVNLENGSNRINAGLDVILNITLNKHPKPLGGSIDISGGLRYDSNLGAFFLNDPIIEKFNIQGIPPAYAEKANFAINKALTEYYHKNPVYTLNALDTKQAAAWLVLKNIIINNKILVVTLGI